MSPEGWLVKTVFELGQNSPETVQTGPFGSQLHSDDYVDEGVPLVLIRNIGATGLTFNNLPRITERDARRLAKYALRPGDIVFSRVGRVGSCFRATEAQNGWIISGQTLRIRLEYDELDPDYLLYALRDKDAQDFITGASVGSTRSSINTSILESLPVRVPPYPEQLLIAKILSTVDRAIEQTEALIAKYRRIKTGLMHDLLTRGIDEHGNLRDPATHKFKPSPVGMVPEEWEVETLRAELDVIHGFAFKGEYFSDTPPGEVLVVPGNFHRDGGLYFTPSNTKYYQGPIPPATVLSPGQLVIVMTDLSPRTLILGRVAEVSTAFPVLHNQRIGLIRTKLPNRWNNRFLLIALNDERLRQKIILSATGTTVRHTSPGRILANHICRPPIDEQGRITDSLDGLDFLMETEQGHVRKLARVKTGLMQDLLTSKVSVAPLLMV